MSNWKESSFGLLPSDWVIKPLGELLYIKGRIGWKGLKKSEYLKEGYAIINGEQIADGKIDWLKVGRIPKDRYDESPEIKLMEGDILMTKDGTIGKLAYIESLLEPATVASGVFVIREESKLLDQKYLYYFFRSHYFAYKIKNRTEGSVVPHLYQRDFTEIEIPLPKRQEQISIAGILSVLDKKIDNSKKQNQINESIAYSIFKEWFVHFRFPGFDGKLVDGLPKGWKKGKVSDTCKVNVQTLSSKEEIKEIRYIEISEVERGVVKNIAIYKRGEEPSRAKRKLSHGDIVLSTVRPNRGSYFLAFHPENNLIASTGFAVFTTTSVPYSFLYCFLTSKEQIEFYGRMADGAAYPSINPAIIMNIDLIIPPNDLLKKYDDIVGKLYAKYYTNLKAIKTLIELRDLLLPNLMTGKIRVN